ncbi:MAG: BamA/TamA family outer membrane protein, partial [Elusimicrobia bacterium]|nr:BamA/TamA family outer membrane protein [Elusimicrobiota bacterium]
MRKLCVVLLFALAVAPLRADDPSLPGIERIEIPHLPSPPAKERLLKWVIRSLTKPIGKKTLFVTIPYVTLDPNSGWSEGLMPVWVVQGSQQNVEHIVAPSLTYNNVFKLTGTLRHFFYPRTKTSVVTVLSRSQRINGQATLQFEDHTLVDGRLFLLAGGGRIIDGANRFFGFGPNTRKSDESAYSVKETRLTLGAGWDLTKYLQAAIFQRYRDVNIDAGNDPDILDTLDRYPLLFGLDPTIVSATIASLSYDTRDSPTTPTRGMFGQLFTEQAGSDVFNTDTEFQRYGAQWRFYLPHGGAPHVTAFRAAFDIAYGRRLPFYEQAQVGGF